jgi:hypothetical protein
MMCLGETLCGTATHARAKVSCCRLFVTATHAHANVSCVRLGVGNPKPTMCYKGDTIRAQQHPSEGYFARSGVRRPTLVLVMCWLGRHHSGPATHVRRLPSSFRCPPPHTRSCRCPPPHTRARDAFFGGHHSGPATHIRKLLCSLRCPPPHTRARHLLEGETPIGPSNTRLTATCARFGVVHPTLMMCCGEGGYHSGPATHIRKLLCSFRCVPSMWGQQDTFDRVLRGGRHPLWPATNIRRLLVLGLVSATPHYR